MPRIFLALNFSVAVTRRIAEEAERLRPAWGQAGHRVAWVPAANLHVTLKFLGATREEALEAVGDRLEHLAAAHAPIEARAFGVGAFPTRERPMVLWVGVDGGEALVALARAVEDGLAELGFDREARAFHPHVTIGRVKERRGDVPADAPELWPAVDCGASALGEIVVYESRTLASGAEYLARRRVPLGRGNVQSTGSHKET